MIDVLREVFDRVEEPVGRKRPTHSLTDCLVSALSMFQFRDGSMLAFDQASRLDARRENLRNLYGLRGAAPSDTTMRRRLDRADPAALHLAFPALWESVDTEEFRVFDGRVPVAVDGTGHFDSTSIGCEGCLTRRASDGTIHHRHEAVVAAAVHVGRKAAIPLGAEPVVRQDGADKQDCEPRAAVRLLHRLRQDFGDLRPIVLGDALYATGPMASTLRELDMDYVLKVREPRHEALLEAGFESEERRSHSWTDPDDEGLVHEVDWCPGTPLSKSFPELRDTLVVWTARRAGPTVGRTEEKRHGWERTMCWFTSLRLDETSLADFLRLARARWRIENEMFNVLKNQGMEMEHNYGHGSKFLATVLMLLMLLAAMIDEFQKLGSDAVRRAREKAGSWKALWLDMRVLVRHVPIAGWEALYAVIAGERKVRLVEFPDTG